MMPKKETLIAVGVTLAVLTALNNIRALRNIKRVVVG